MEIKLKFLVIIIVILLLISGCSYKEDKVPKDQEVALRYYEFLKVNDDLTISGVNEINSEDLVDREYFQFIYKKGQVSKIISHSSLANSFHELNKYIYNVNKEWKEINIINSSSAKEYTFSYDKELIKFLLTYNNQQEATSFQVIPFNINYDNFNILGRSVIYTGKFVYNTDKLLEKIIWNDSNAEYHYTYNKNNIMMTKNIYQKGSILYEYRYESNKQGIVIGIK
ncbi:hypothetical protein JEZ13_04625 [bacterium]|nr:hypothetical protein [bacterium]